MGTSRTTHATQASVDTQWAAVIARLDELEQTNAAMQVKVRSLEAELTAARARPPISESGRTKRQTSRRTSRRKLLQLGGAAAVATVAAGVLAGERDTAHAASARADTITDHQIASGSGNIAIEGDGTSGADGVHGTSDTGYGVYGLSTSGTGVVGLSSSGAAVSGSSTTGDGVQGGSGGTGTGVIGSSTDGFGVYGASSNLIGGFFSGGRAPLGLGLGGAPGAPSSGFHTKGEVYLDSTAAVWVCTASGGPGTWKQVVVAPSSGSVTVQQSASGSGHTAIEGDGTSGADGVHGTSDTGTGVNGHSTSGAGVNGQTDGNFSAGVYGYATAADGKGVWGFCPSGTGIEGQSTSGIGGLFFGGQAPLQLGLGGSTGAPASGTHSAGEIYLDSASVTWVCVKAGTPGTWVRLPGVANGANGGALTFLTTPIRLLDTRSGFAAATTPNTPIQPGAINTFHLPVAGVSYNPGTGTVTIPSSAKALVGNCTVVNPAGVGDLAAYPDLLPLPNTAVMHYLTGQIVSNGITIGLGTNGHLAITALGSATDVIIDCQGFIA